MTSENLAELADRVEALDGPSREEDCEAAKAFGWRGIVLETNGLWRGFHPNEPRKTRRQIPAFTASVDATMPYVPANCLAMVRELWNEDCTTKSGFASLHRYSGHTWAGESNGDAATMPLAFLAAALRARSAQ